MFDLAFQENGAIEAVVDLMKQNGLEVTAQLAPGDTVTLSDGAVSDDINGYYKGNNLHPATGMTGAPTGIGAEGISYWAIGVDFIIS